MIIDILMCRGEQFRTDYSRLGMVSAFSPNVPLYALTATARRHDRKMIITTCMKDVKNIVGNIYRPNIFIEKQSREGADDEGLQRIILPIVEGLTKLIGKLSFDHNLSAITVVWICI